MHMIAYISDYIPSITADDDVVQDIVTVAQHENRKNQITGVLFFLEGKFLQVIEGKEESLRQLMANISRDDRHHNITTLIDRPIEMRGFSHWNMDSFKLDGSQRFDAATMEKLTRSFEKLLQPSSDMLVYYYKALLAQAKA